jgi:hypothetical protein
VTPQRPSPLIHLELHTGDQASATRFYSRLSAWRTKRIETGAPISPLRLGGEIGGGIVECGAPRPNHYLSHPHDLVGSFITQSSASPPPSREPEPRRRGRSRPLAGGLAGRGRRSPASSISKKPLCEAVITSGLQQRGAWAGSDGGSAPGRASCERWSRAVAQTGRAERAIA